ncbi:MAG TPA: BREX-1 system adenine-specific DNA-methyltransferase PglX, partial [Firmicutes bacterium]|nr:BREX-1 system adenine-specific DNA-methyltransferase PglX [Bacillota bacterium]
KQRWERGEADQAYRNFLLWQCSQMPAAVKVLFDPEDLHSRIFPRPQILHQVLAYINEEQMNGAWKEDEAIGWLYQFFIEEDKKAVFDKIYSQKKKMGLRDIPVATQLFTPRWIVRYLVENTLGRLWLRMYPNSRLRDKMEYYVPNPVNDDELLPLRPVREITLLDPACGTMHFGVVAFDLFYEMYLEEIERAGEEGWPQTASASSEAEIPSLILSQNLYGIDLDLRAVQLSALALLIKAMTKNPQVKLERINLVCTDITPFDSRTKQSFLGQLQLKHQIARQLLDELLPYLDKAYYLGSLLKIEQVLHEFIARGREKMNYGGGPLIEYAKETGKLDDGGDAFWDEVKEEILEALEKASRDRLNGNAYVAGKSIWGMGLVDALMKKYDVVVCNPPYSGRRNMDANLSKELKEYYPKKDGDLYSTFIDRCLDLVAPRTGFCGMVTIHSFMFTSSYEEIRKKIINGSEIISILHLGTKTEFDLSNPNAQGFVAFVSGKCTHIKHSNYKESIYFRIIKDVGQKKMTSFERALQDWKRNLGNHQDKNIFILKQRDLKAIPGWPFVYWISDSIRDMFINNKLLANRAKACQGLATADNFRFLRLWWELTPDKIGYNCSDAEDAESTNKAWFPYMKGGDYQRWYGNQDFIINWDQNGREIKNFYKNGKLAS